MKSRASWTVPAAALLFAVYFISAWQHVRKGVGRPAFDTYQYVYPNMIYAARSLADGGRGFFWNTMFACGQPFFSISSTSTLYPPHFLFYVLDPDLALRAVLVVGLVIAGVGAYLLCREIGLGRIAAFCGALCFELGNATIDLTSWMPLSIAPFAWLPVIMLCCERLLRAPSAGGAVLFGLAMTMALLSGYPQVVVQTGQLIGLRILWEFLTRRRWQRFSGVAGIGFGLVIALLLAAMVILPATEFARDSVRGFGLTRMEILGVKPFSWSDFVVSFDRRSDIFNPIIVVPAAIAAAALIPWRTRRIALFYTAGALLYFTLAFGDATPLFDWYLELPLAKSFREPARLFWMVTFCMSVVTACGVEGLVGSRRAVSSRGARIAGLAFFGAAVFGLSSLGRGLRVGDWLLLAIVATATVVAIRWRRWRRFAALALAAAIVANLVAFPLWRVRGGSNWFLRELPLRSLVAGGEELRVHRAVFEGVRRRMTAQDRAYIVHPHPKLDLTPKTGALFDVPVVQDYEPQPSRRFAEYFFMMRKGWQMKAATQYYVVLDATLLFGFQRRLLDLAAARYLIVERNVDTTAQLLKPAPRLIEDGAVRTYENPLALQRARFVPRIEIVPDPGALLQRLARGDDDLRAISLVEEALASNFMGSTLDAPTGTVEFVRDDPESIALRVEATGRGFVHLADQYAPGWYATVNGAPVEIARANYLFRLIEVPQGESIVELRYAPMSVRLGAAISAVTALALLAYGVRCWRRRPKGAREIAGLRPGSAAERRAVG